MILERVISGFQTGADIAAIKAAKECGIPTSGWMPRGFLTETGPRPEYAQLYGAREHKSSTYPPRTYANVFDADATVWFGSLDTLGYRCTKTAIEQKFITKQLDRMFWCRVTEDDRPSDLTDWIRRHGVRTLNCAGSRESKSPGIERWVYEFLCEVFRLLGETNSCHPSPPSSPA
jgi:hypothetical protein